MLRSLPRRIEQVRLSISSLSVLPSPVNGRVGIHDFTSKEQSHIAGLIGTSSYPSSRACRLIFCSNRCFRCESRAAQALSS
jgi:hypothetical protein